MLVPAQAEEAAELSHRDELEECALKKQEMLVQYLSDTESFVLQVEKAIAVINTMLYWKTTSGRPPDALSVIRRRSYIS